MCVKPAQEGHVKVVFSVLLMTPVQLDSERSPAPISARFDLQYIGKSWSSPSQHSQSSKTWSFFLNLNVYTMVKKRGYL